MAARTRKALSRGRILEQALAVADAEGINSLSMRKLGRSLGFEAMSLYNHVANKGDLVDAMFELVMTEVELPRDSEGWDTAIRSYATAMHDALIRHPWAGNLAVGLGSGGCARVGSRASSPTTATTCWTRTSSASRCGNSATTPRPAR